MNLLKTIIERLNQRVEVANIFDQIYPLCELNANGNEKAWVHYIGNGQAEVVTNFDAKQGTLFWAKRGKVSVTKTESLKVSGCKTLYQTTFPLTAYAVVRKSHLPCDSEDSQDWIASRIYRLISGTDPDFKVAIGVIQYEVIPNGYVNEIKSLTANYEWACVAVDVDVSVVSSSEDGCYDVCSTGDIPLPDFEPCTPCLTEVAVDGVTITGNGTTADPLIAIGGGGSIVLQTDDVNNGSQSILNLKEGTNITLTDDGVGGVTIDASGGGTPQVNSDWNANSGVAQILNKPNLATVATSGSYTDLINQPTIPPAQIQSDWNQTNNTLLDYIKNKPTIPVVTGFVPYTGATNNVDLGTHTLSAKDLVINHPSGSGVAASITKGGSGEALTVVKSSGSGNAASITGGVTLIDELHLTTDLADAYIASAATWNAKQDALILTTTGTSGAATLTGATLNIPQYGGSGEVYPYVQKEFTSSTTASAIIKIPGSDVIFVAYTSTATVVAYNTLTSQILSTTAVAGASGLVYVATTGQVWAFGSAASITRFTATTGASLGATAVLLLTASCRGVYDDSTVTGNVYAYNGGTMNVINHLTYARTAVSIGAGSGSNELTLVTSGVQAGLLVGTVNVGIFGFNKTTNTLAYGPGLPANYTFIKFVPSLGVFLAASVSLNIVSFITPTTSTTLTVTSSVRGIQSPYQFEFDETENRLFIPSTATGTSQIRIAVVELTTLTWIKSVLITAVTANSNTWVTSDKANKALYAVGVSAGGSINKIIYA